VVGVRATAAAFLDELVARMPFAVEAIPADGGSEFMAAFERGGQDRGIARSVPPPRGPKLNGRVERRATAPPAASSGNAMMVTSS